MKRSIIIVLSIFLSICASGQIVYTPTPLPKNYAPPEIPNIDFSPFVQQQVPKQTVPTKEEMFKSAKLYHNGSLIKIQGYDKDNNLENLKSAIKLSSMAAYFSKKCMVERTDTHNYGCDAVDMVINNNYIMAYAIRRYIQGYVSSDDISLNDCLSQYISNFWWMASMLELNKDIEWLWESITIKDLYAVNAVVQFFSDANDWEESEYMAGDRSLLKLIFAK